MQSHPTSALDILCNVAATAASPPPPLPPPLQPPVQPVCLRPSPLAPPIAAAAAAAPPSPPTPTARTQPATPPHPNSTPIPIPMPLPLPHPPKSAPVPRLSSSAPATQSILTHMSPERVAPPTFSTSPIPPYTAPSFASRLQRNMSAPALGYACTPYSPLIIHADSLPTHSSMLSTSPSPNIPVPPRAAAIPAARTAPVAFSPPLYGCSPPSRRAGKSTARAGGKAPGRRDTYTRFTAEEESMLLDGVRVYGVGNWKKILNSYRFHWKRTAVDLKDKYRNITRAKLRKMNASSQELSSESDPVQPLTPPHSLLLNPTPPIGISPVSTPSTTPSGSIDDSRLTLAAPLSIKKHSPVHLP